MSKFLSKSSQSNPAANSKLETTAEKNIGKEINVVNGKDFNHLDLIIEAKNNRLKSEFFYIYDYDKFNNCSLLKENFDVLASNQITHNSARYVIHYLTMELKKRFKEITGNPKATKQEQALIYDVFKPSLGQFDDADISEANNFIRSMFPYEGCSFTGEKLEALITKSTWITLILSLRIIWSLLPNAIIPWKSYHKFEEYEKKANYSNMQSFYQVLPTSLPSHNHACVLFEFLEILLYVFADNFFLDLNVAADLIFTAGQICFNRDEFKPTKSQNDDDLNELQTFYYKRGYAFYQIFIAYLRSLSKEPNFGHQTLLELFKINEYPPKPYKPVTQKALTLTVPSDPELSTTNYFKLISNASNATSRIYSSNHNFTKFENKFLDKFEINPHKIIEHFFSKSSKNYLLKFDKNLNFENFKVGNDINEFRKGLKNGTLFENKELISTMINDFSRYGFDKADSSNQNGSFVADTINFNFNSNMENIDNNPVRVSKLEISEWFINAWKYETFLGFLQNTVVLKLTKTIGDCDWLIITSADKVSNNNRYLTPPSSAQDAVDSEKEKELGQYENKDNNQKKDLLPAFNLLGGKKSTERAEPSAPRHTKRSSPKKSDLKRISHPSPPKDIAVFESAQSGKSSFESTHSTKPVAGFTKVQTPVSKVDADTIGSEKSSVEQNETKSLEQPLEVTKAEPIPVQKVQSLVDNVIETPKSSIDNKSQSGKSDSESLKSTKEVVSPVLKEQSPLPAPPTEAETKVQSKVQTPTQVQAPSAPAPGPASQSPRIQPPAFAKQRLATPPQQVSRNFNNPPPIVKDDQNTNSLNSATAKQFSAPMPRPLQSPANYLPKSPVGAPMRFKQEKPNSPKAHPYSQFQHQSPQKAPRQQYQTPPNRAIEKFESSPSPHFNFTKPMNSPTAASSNGSLPSSKPQSKTNRLSKLAIATKDVQAGFKNFSPSNSPISQAIPKFFKKDFTKLPNSSSSGSLSHINDGSGSETSLVRKSTLLVNNPELDVNIDTIPEIPYTPKALREAQFSTSSVSSVGSNRDRSTSTVNSKKDDQNKEGESTADFNKLLSDNRENFTGISSVADTSVASEKSLPELVESHEGDDTQDTTKTTHDYLNIEQNLDGLLEEIKESLDNSEKFFSTDDLSGKDTSINV